MASQDIIIGIKTQFEGDMGKTLEKVDSSVKGATKSVDKLGDTQEKAGKQSKQAGKSFSQSAKEIAAGIGVAKLAEGAFGLLKDALMSNQLVADTLKGVMEGFNIILTEVVGVLVESIKSVYENTNGFDSLFKVLKGGITIALTPFKIAWYSISEAITAVMLLWEKSPFGSGDTEKIKGLEKDLEETAKKIKGVGSDYVDAVVDIVTNVGGAIKEVGQVVSKVGEGLSKIDLEKSLKAGKALVALEKLAKSQDEKTKKDLADLEKEAEQKRQIRDDDTTSINERIKANEDLGVILQKEKTIGVANAELQLKAARARFTATKKDEDNLKVKEALTALSQVESDIEGKLSEQKQNKVALGKEEVAIGQSRVDNIIEIGLKEQQYSTARIKDEEKRLIQTKADLEDEKIATLTNLNDKIKATKENTQARVDAEREYLTKKIEIDNQISQTDDQINAVRLQKNKTRLETELQDTIDAEKEKASELVAGSPARLEAEGNILQMQLDYYTLHKSELFKTDEEYAAKKRDLEKQISDNDKAELDTRKQNAFAVGQEILSQLSSYASSIGAVKDNESKAEITRLQDENNIVLQSEADKVNATAVGTEGRKKAEINYSKIKEGLDKKLEEQKKKIDKDSFERGKKIAIATSLINGAQAIVAAFATPDPTFGILTAIRVGAAISATAIQVKAIQAQTFDGGSTTPSITGGDAPSAGAAAQTSSAPSTMGIGSVNIASRKQELQFQQVFVVESDIRNVTNRVEVIENRSVLGS